MIYSILYVSIPRFERRRSKESSDILTLKCSRYILYWLVELIRDLLKNGKSKIDEKKTHRTGIPLLRTCCMIDFTYFAFKA